MSRLFSGKVLVGCVFLGSFTCTSAVPEYIGDMTDSIQYAMVIGWLNKIDEALLSVT